MDTLSHGLWGAAAAGRSDRRAFGQAFFFGVFPDLFAFAPGMLAWAWQGFPPLHKKWGEPPPLSAIPEFTFHLYDFSHSLLVWGALFAAVWLFCKKPFWPMAAWGLHILCDIPTHSTRYFPTPFLWPFETPYVNGMAWNNMKFMVCNYSLLGLALFTVWKTSLKPRT